MEKISIIVPVYNVEKYLEKCLKSIISQTYKNLEIIVVNDGSIDNSLEICKKFEKIDKRIKVIDKENGGLSDARNAGLKIAAGDYIGFVDSDDYISEDMFETLGKLLKEHNAEISIVSYYEMMDNRLLDVQKDGTLDIMNKEEAIKELLIDKKIQSYAWNKLFKKEIFEGIIFPTGKNFEDIATTLLLFEKADKIVRLEEPKYFYLRRNDSIVGIRNYKTYLDYIEVIIDKYNYLKGKYPSIEEYNEYNLIINIIWVYTIIVRFEIEGLEEKIDEIYPTFKKLVEKNSNLINEKLDYYNKSMLSMMLLDRKMSKKAIKELYIECKKLREEGEFSVQI